MFRRLSHLLVVALVAAGGAFAATGPAQAAGCAGADEVSLKTHPTMSNPDGTYAVKISSCAAKELYDAYPLSSDMADATIGKFKYGGEGIAMVVKLGNKLSQAELKDTSGGFSHGIECTMSGADWVSGCKAQ